MDPFGAPPSSLSGTQASNEHMMGQLKQQLAQAYAEEFFSVGLEVCSSKQSYASWPGVSSCHEVYNGG